MLDIIKRLNKISRRERTPTQNTNKHYEGSLPAIFTFTSAHRGLDEPHEGDPVLGLGAGRGAVSEVVVRPWSRGASYMKDHNQTAPKLTG